MNTFRKKDRLIVVFLTCLLFSFNQKANSAEKPKTTNQPPVVRIIAPKNGEVFKVGERVVFEGKATDLEDGEISGRNLIWTSDLNGRIGEGSYFSYDKLLAGIHIIVLTATDSGNSQDKHSIFITVGAQKTLPMKEAEPKDKPGSEKKVEPVKPQPEKPKSDKPVVEKSLIEDQKIVKKGLPSIEFTFIPAFGSFEDLKGRVLNANPKDFAVVVFIMRDIIWWTRPSRDIPVTKINSDGIWTCDITTDKFDELAIKIVAYLIPQNYKPPAVSGNFRIPQELEKNSLAKVEVTRKVDQIKIEQLKEEKEDPKKYFPLNVGNSWKYKRMISPGKVPLIQFKYEVIEDLNLTGDQNHEILIIGFEPFAASRNETYKVLSKEDKTFVIEGYSIDEKGEKGKAQGFEPYSLQELKKLIWRVNEWSDKTFVVHEIREGINLGNEVRSLELIGFFKPDRGLLIDVEPNDLGLEFEPKSYYKKVMAEYEREPVKVPAGTFSKTIKNTFEFIGGVTGENVKIIRFFAKDIGLVKEVQYDSKGEITYTLELVECEVK